MTMEQPAWTADLLEKPHLVPDKAKRIRRMFNGIARRYELVNRLFSGGRDATWRRQAVRLARVRPDDVVLDVACGTGDFARAFLAGGAGMVVGCDFAHQMLLLAASRDRPNLYWCEADAQNLPFRDGSFSITSCAFGVRNFTDLDLGLSEMHRVLVPRGQCVILEFTRPHHRLVRSLYEFYAGRFMPWAATLVSGDRTGAYRYLPRSVVSFPDAEQMGKRLRQAGFVETRAVPLTWGAVTIYLARRA